MLGRMNGDDDGDDQDKIRSFGQSGDRPISFDRGPSHRVKIPILVLVVMMMMIGGDIDDVNNISHDKVLLYKK